MRVLHYALGFPPYRSGGLTKFCVDLMQQQVKEGHNVGMLWPGRMRLFARKPWVKQCGRIALGNEDVDSFEIVNPLPVSYDEGIVDIDVFTADCEKDGFRQFLASYKPDVVHVHTLMGLHKAFLEVVKEEKIQLVFSAHDFFPICPKVTLFRDGEVCKNSESCQECAQCNTSALSLGKICILQSPAYKCLKDSVVVKKLRKKHRDAFLGEEKKESGIKPVRSADDYKRLRAYYATLLKMMDVIHYNSSVTKNVYEKFFDLPEFRVISITHSDICDHRKYKKFPNDIIRLRYLGPQGGAKGFFLLKRALDELWEKQQNFSLSIHFEPLEMAPYMNVYERYAYEELEKIFDDTDLLIVPSIWLETFGYTALEALSYGVPVVISGTAGVKDILVTGAGIVIDNITSEKLRDVLMSVTAEELISMNRIIVNKQDIMQMQEMSAGIENACYGWN